MKIPTHFLHRVLLDEGLQVGLTIERDYEEIHSRFEHEGMSFLAITLPVLSKCLLKGLSTGRIGRSDFPGFRPRSRASSLPALLSGFFMRVFKEDGHLLDDPCIASIRAIHQVARLFAKIELPCSSARQSAAYERYQSNDEGLCWNGFRNASDDRLYTIVCGHLWADLETFSEELFCSPGKFGSGATAEHLLFNERHSVKQWPSRSEPWFPSDFHATHDFRSGLNDIQYLSESDELPVRVVQVPKTLKTPRTISVEPSYMMLMQQSIAKPLMDYLEGSYFPFDSIRFTFQSVNQDMAKLGSLDGRLATIDLKDASDLVSNDVVKKTFSKVSPAFLDLIQACRSQSALLPDKTVLPLKKFASMGSALCFPIEAMVFFTIVMYSLVKQSGRDPSFSLLKSLSKDVAVYGDDIIIPSKMVSGVIDDLESFGLKVNRDKSFSTGFFRESCGGEYYKGVEITPTYVRQWDFTGTLREASLLVAYVSLSNQLYMKGMWHGCQSIRDVIDRRNRLPFARGPRGYLHHASFTRESGLVWFSDLSGYRVRSVVANALEQADSPTNLAGFMLRTLLSAERRDRRNREFSRSPQSECKFGLQRSERLRRRVSKPQQSTSRGYIELYLRDAEVPETRELLPTTYVGMSSRALRDLVRRDPLLIKEGSSSAYTSVRPYTLKSKCKWMPSPEGLNW